MEALILQGVVTLDFLFSTINASAKEGNVPKLQQMLSRGPAEPVQDIVDADFFLQADAVYKNTLLPVRELFGIQDHSCRDQAKFTEAYREYVMSLEQVLLTWAANRKMTLAKSDQPPAEYAKVLDGFKNRLQLVLKYGLFNCTAFGMTFPTPPPLLTGLFLLDVGGSLTGLRPWLDFVMQWIDPNVLVGAAIQGFGGTSLMFQSAIERFAPRKGTQVALNKVLACIFKYRSTALVQMRNADTSAGRHPSHMTIKKVADGYEQNWKDDLAKLGAVLKTWRSRAAGAKDDLNKAPPLLKHLPPEQEGVLKRIKDGDILLNALVETCFPWAFGSPNTMTHRLQSAVAAASQSLLLTIYQKKSYLSLDNFIALRQELESVLKSATSNFKQFWDLMEIEDGHVLVPSSSQEPFSTRTRVSLDARAKEIQKFTKQAVRSIVKLVSNKDAGGIPVALDEHSGIPHPHEDVYFAAKALFEAMAVASHRAQSIYTDPMGDRSAQLTRQMISALYTALDIPDTFQPAPDAVVAAYYTQTDIEELTQLESMGDGSLALQRRMAAAERAKQSKQQRARNTLQNQTQALVDPDTTLVSSGPLPPSSPPSDSISSCSQEAKPDKAPIDFPSPPSFGLTDAELATVSSPKNRKEEEEENEGASQPWSVFTEEEEED